MITVKAPAVYVHEANILEQSGSRIAQLGQHALIIAGESAWKAVQPYLLPSLEEHKVKFHVQLFHGEVTTGQIDTFTQQAFDLDVDLIIGVGGGKVLDLSKAVAEQAQLPIVTVPTIAATCAAWSALTVLYDEQGQSAGYRPLRRSPNLVLADPHILASAPRRYLAAGIGDTLVKWHEFAVNLSGNATSLTLRNSVSTAKLALDILEAHAIDVYESTDTTGSTPQFRDVADAIIVLAGLVGSISDGSLHAAIAHGLHDSLTKLPETHASLHGEKVAFGLFTQWILEGKAGDELQELLTLLHKLNLPITLAQLGIQQQSREAAARIAAGLQLREGSAAHLSFGVSATLVTEAILQADQIGQTFIESSNSIESNGSITKFTESVESHENSSYTKEVSSL
ncbi:iron-containing alcohol dehydrogenase family protein [Paenibacillus pabuli]|uniref:iron-containing alcohol dehydrogenase family protein n=1 Tax=Paenibacillus pabuli TaxID=1472 RepID=UPI000781DB32|nr:iron-containing alcohol dehydrogenase family protein [Paenibacillus pabuli]MEC0129037.1 iron-containing alcohol dehydrogenase family protein [Paenibacillus pabuli]